MTTKIRHLLSGVTLIIFLILGVASGSDDNKKEVPKSETTEATSSTPEVEEKKLSWNYETSEDKMSNEKRYFATCASTNVVEFKFPYAGGSSFTITLRNMGKGNEILLQVSKGQFMPSIGDMQSVRVRFDDEKPTKYSYNSAADGSADVIFLNNSNRFLASLKKAKKVMVEAEFFQEGNQIMEFNVEGLQWER